MKKILIFYIILASGGVYAKVDCDQKVVSIEGNKTIVNQEPTINLDFKNNRVFGKTGCNSYFGEFNSNKDKIEFTNLGSTLMACFPQEVMTQEISFLKALSQTKSLSKTKDGDIYLDKDFNKLFETKKCKSLRF